MSQRMSWLKTGTVFAIIILFFIIVTGFFRENNKLLQERVFWQEKANSFEEEYNRVLKENNVFSTELNAIEKGLSINGVKLESVKFVPGDDNNLTYSLLIEVENTSKQKRAGATGFCLFSLLNQGGKSISGTAWRSFALPELKPGEKKVLNISGKFSARPKAELLIFVNILGEPGMAKARATLPEKPPPPKKEEMRKPPTPNQAIPKTPEDVTDQVTAPDDNEPDEVEPKEAKVEETVKSGKEENSNAQ